MKQSWTSTDAFMDVCPRTRSWRRPWASVTMLTITWTSPRTPPWKVTWTHPWKGSWRRLWRPPWTPPRRPPRGPPWNHGRHRILRPQTIFACLRGDTDGTPVPRRGVHLRQSALLCRQQESAQTLCARQAQPGQINREICWHQRNDSSWTHVTTYGHETAMQAPNRTYLSRP